MWRRLFVFFLAPVLFSAGVQPGGPLLGQIQAADSVFLTPEGLVRELYRAVTFTPGMLPDWNYVRRMFLPQAVIELRTSRDSTSIFTLEGFVDDFEKFIKNFHAEQTGFEEKVLRLKQVVFGEMAHALVLYQAAIPGSTRRPTQGVDSFSLVRKEGRWWIAAITNEIVTPTRPAPSELQGNQ